MPLLLGYVAAFGLVWDGLYAWLQGFRWDRDWPWAYQFGAGVLEGALVFALFRVGMLPGLDFGEGDAGRFLVHYGTVFLAVYVSLTGPMRVLSPRWRFQGGEIVAR